MKLKFLLIMLMIAGFARVYAQNNPENDHEGDHHHHHHKNELGLSNSAVYIFEEEKLAYSLHLHYIRLLGDSKFGLGPGVEMIFGEHSHNTVGLVLAYSPLEPLTLAITPGVTFGHESHNEFSMAAEAIYAFNIGVFHIGPAIEFSYLPHDYHISVGFHIGFGF